MKKVFMFLTTCVAVLGLMACSAGNETNAENTAAEENVEAEAQPTATPQQRDFENADLSLTIPEGWTGKIGAFDEIKMEGKGENGFDPKIEVDVLKDRKVNEVVENEMGEGIVKKEGVKIGNYTFTMLINENSGANKCYAQVGDNVLRVIAVFINPDTPEVTGVVESIKLK